MRGLKNICFLMPCISLEGKCLQCRWFLFFFKLPDYSWCIAQSSKYPNHDFLSLFYVKQSQSICWISNTICLFGINWSRVRKKKINWSRVRKKKKCLWCINSSKSDGLKNVSLKGRIDPSFLPGEYIYPTKKGDLFLPVFSSLFIYPSRLAPK